MSRYQRIKKLNDKLNKKWENNILSFIKYNIDKDLNWYSISSNPYITFEMVLDNEHLPWKWVYISRHKNITWDIIEKYPNKPWNWNGISQNKNITIDIILKNPDKPWNWINISMNEKFNLGKYKK